VVKIIFFVQRVKCLRMLSYKNYMSKIGIEIYVVGKVRWAIRKKYS